MNPLLEPIQRSERMGPLGMTLKRDKNNGPIHTALEVPKKKPKIVAQEVLKFPVFRLPLGQQDTAPAMRNLKKNMSNNDWRVDTKVFQKLTKGLQISKDTGESERRMVHIEGEPREKNGKVGKETNAEGKSDRVNGKETGKNFRNPSERDSPFLKKRFPPNYSDLSMLQRKITENSQSLIKQAEEMKRLRYLPSFCNFLFTFFFHPSYSREYFLT